MTSGNTTGDGEPLSAHATLCDEETVQQLAALAQSTRLLVFKHLMRAQPSGLAAGVIAETLQVAPNTLSAHLTVLSKAGLVSAQRRGRQIVYSVVLASVTDLLDVLVNDCCGGHPEICAPVTRSMAEDD
ncbi:MAG: metalloregulator ArsR/SmtB family transcription factor [Pseudomonadota bacterium]